MLPKNHYNVVLKNASGLYIGVPSNPFDKIIGLSKLDISLGDDIDNIQQNEIGIIYTDYEYEELILKRVYAIHHNPDEIIDLLNLESEKLYDLIAHTLNDYSINNPI